MLRTKRRSSPLAAILTVAVLLIGFCLPTSPTALASVSADTVTVTVLHTNDFHGNLELSGSNPGLARLAKVVNDVRSSVGAQNVALLDAGDIMQGSLISNLFKGKPTIDLFNFMGYKAATFGNHEFDWGQGTLAERTGEADFPFVSANIVVNDTGNCATAGWTSPAWAQPFTTITLGEAGNQVTLGVIGVTTQEAPYITIASATEGLCFKDPAESIIHHFDAAKAAGAEAIVVLSHLGFTDGGYGYGFSVYGDQTLATRLATANKKPAIIIGGHSHTDVAAATLVQGIPVVQAHYAGRKVGRADITVNKVTGAVSTVWQRLTVSTSGAEDPDVKARIGTWTNDPWYQGEISRVVGYTAVDLVRNYNGDSTMGAFVNDAIYNDFNTDQNPANDVDIVFNNPGGLRADILTNGVNPFTLTHGQLFSVLPFGNATVVGEMTGAHIMELLNQSATLFKGAIQVSGVRFSFFNYTDALPGPQPWAWGAFNAQVKDPETGHWRPLDANKTYRIATNEFLAPAGQDGFVAFKYTKNISYWGDMLDGVERWVSKSTTQTNPYRGRLDGRIARSGTAAGGPVVPVTVLHHNDSHGNLYKGRYVGYTQLATLIKQARAHNPTRTLLVNAGDQIQGDAMMYYYKNAPMGTAADGTPLPLELQKHPMMAAMNSLGYDAWTLGNHEYNFGKEVFQGVLKQAAMPVLQANLRDTGAYGIASVPVRPYTIVKVPAPTFNKEISVAILGIGNHRVPNYELPSNIPGLTFPDPIAEARALVPGLQAQNDAVIALTHIGFTSNPKSVEVDTKVDTNLAALTSGINAIIGSHSHTDPTKKTDASGDYHYLPTVVGAADGSSVLVTQAYRYNSYLGSVVLGFLPNPNGTWRVVSQAGRYEAVAMSTPEDAATKSVVTPYLQALDTYTKTVIGQTTIPLDALKGYTEETNGANIQADASVWELGQHGITVDFHLSGAMSNRKVADAATPANPVNLTVNDMFSLMPYENSLVAMQLNGPMLKAILERAYRNYYYYKYVPGAGGYSYYTTCMLDTNAGNEIVYKDTYPTLPDGNNVVSLKIGGQAIDFADAAKFYLVSTVNYLAAGSCNFNDAGVSLWPLSQIVHDTQYYVRDAVIGYTKAQTTPLSTGIEGRVVFQTSPAAAAFAATETDSEPLVWFEFPGWTTVSPDVPDEDTLNVDQTFAVPDFMPKARKFFMPLH